MDHKQLAALRPHDDSVAGIEVAIDRIDAALAAVATQLGTAREARPELLLSGTSGDLDRHTARVRALETDLEQLEALRRAACADLPAARGRVRLAELTALHAEAAETAEAFRVWWTVKYPALADAIAAGLAGEAVARRARLALDTALQDTRNSPDIAAAGGMPPLAPVPQSWGYAGATFRAPASWVCLPATEPGRPYAWPAGYSLERTKEGVYA